MRRLHVASTSVSRHYNVICLVCSLGFEILVRRILSAIKAVSLALATAKLLYTCMISYENTLHDVIPLPLKTGSSAV